MWVRLGALQSALALLSNVKTRKSVWQRQTHKLLLQQGIIQKLSFIVQAPVANYKTFMVVIYASS